MILNFKGYLKISINLVNQKICWYYFSKMLIISLAMIKSSYHDCDYKSNCFELTNETLWKIFWSLIEGKNIFNHLSSLSLFFSPRLLILHQSWNVTNSDKTFVIMQYCLNFRENYSSGLFKSPFNIFNKKECFISAKAMFMTSVSLAKLNYWMEYLT